MDFQSYEVRLRKIVVGDDGLLWLFKFFGICYNRNYEIKINNIYMKVSHVIHKIRSFRKGRQNEEGQEGKSSAPLISGLIVVVGIIVAVGIVSKWSFFINSPLNINEAKTKAEQFIVANLSGGKKAEVKEISDGGNGLYKIMVQLEGAPSLIESYITKDGTLFFPEVLKMDIKINTNGNSVPQPIPGKPR